MMKYLTFALAILCLTSCGMKKNNRDIKNVIRSVEKTNKSLPVDYDVYTMDKMEVDEQANQCITYFTLDEEKRDMESFLSDFEETFLTNFSISYNSNNRFYEHLVKSGLDLKYVITGKQSKTKKEVILTAKQLKEASETKVDAKELMQETLEDIQAELPLDAGRGLSITEIYIDGDYLCYKVLNDESVKPMQELEMMQQGGPELENAIISSFNTTTDQSNIHLAKLLKDANMGIKYIYFSDKSSTQVVADVTPKMFKERVRDRN